MAIAGESASGDHQKHPLLGRVASNAVTVAGMRSSDIPGWGFGLWLFSYLLGFVLYAFVPPAQTGWYAMPLAATIVVLWRRICIGSLREAVLLGVATDKRYLFGAAEQRLSAVPL